MNYMYTNPFSNGKKFHRFVLLFLFIAEEGTPEFNQFLDLLGDTVNLLGWEQYKGGLDVKSRQELLIWHMPHKIFLSLTCIHLSLFLLTDNATGNQSLYTVFEGHEIMFHVSTMLPYSEENKQQVGILFLSPVSSPLAFCQQRLFVLIFAVKVLLHIVFDGILCV